MKEELLDTLKGVQRYNTRLKERASNKIQPNVVRLEQQRKRSYDIQGART